jgi:hypothetical protein
VLNDGMHPQYLSIVWRQLSDTFAAGELDPKNWTQPIVG